MDRVINEQFQIGGTDILIHKYLGPVDPQEGESTPITPNNTNPIPELGIQDVLFMENRDRHYAPDVYVIRGIYTMADLDFNLSQFGLFLNNDTIMIMFHLRSIFECLGRKIMSGDVIELPHQKDEYALDDSIVALKRFYVVQDVTRPSIGYSQTWYPHLLRAKCVPLIDSQEFKEILDVDSGAEDGSTLRDMISTYKASIDINNQIIKQAELDSPVSGYDTNNLFMLPRTSSGLIDLVEGSITTIDDASSDTQSVDASVILASPNMDMYVAYGESSLMAANGAPYGFGVTFPVDPAKGHFFLRTDYMPNRLFRYDGKHWIKFQDDVRMTMDNFGYQDVKSGPFEGKQVRETLKTSFINNINTATIAGEIVTERQFLSKALKPKADN